MPEISLEKIAETCRGSVEGDGAKLIRGLAPLEAAGADEITFVLNRRRAKDLEGLEIGAVIVDKKTKVPEGINVLRVDNPNLARAQAAWLFVDRPVHPGRVMDGALVDPSAEVVPGATVYPQAFVGPGAVIKAGAVIHPQVYIGAEVQVGPDTEIWPQAVVYPGCTIGARCIIHAGTVIGADGFGFAQTGLGEHVKIPQTGTVIIGDDVEIGANSCVDRATFGNTTIGPGTKIDNQVQIGHNVNVGRSNIIIAQVGISGSVNIGDNCMLAGRVGISDHTNIGSRVILGADSKVMNDLPDGFYGGGTPAQPALKAMRIVATQLKLPEMANQLADLESRLAALEKKSTGEEEE